MKSIKKILKSVVIISAFAALLIGTVAYASLGDLTMYNSPIEPKALWEEDFSSYPDESKSTGVTNTYSNTNFILNTKYNEGLHANVVSKATEGDITYVTATNAYLKVDNFYNEETAGKWCIVTARARAHNATEVPDATGFMLGSVINNKDTFEKKSTQSVMTLYALIETNQDKWIDVSLGFKVPEFTTTDTSKDWSSLAVKFGPSAASTTGGGWQSWDFDNIRVTIHDIDDKGIASENILTYAGKDIQFFTEVNNNTNAMQTASLIIAVYDDKGEINYTDVQEVVVGASEQNFYKWDINLPEEFDENWRLRTYLWSDDGEIEAYCDEKTELMEFNLNSDMEILDPDSPTGLYRWKNNVGNCTISSDSYGGKNSVIIPKGADLAHPFYGIWAKYGFGNYRMTAMMKADASANATIAYKVNSDSANWKKQDITVGTEWQQYTLDFSTVTFNHNRNATVNIVNNSAGNIYVDDVVVTKIVE